MLDDVPPLSLSLDHVGLAIRNLDEGRAAFERMGFTLSPRSMHAGATTAGGPVVPWGSGNHCAMFKRGYFEVLGLVDADKPSNVKMMLERYQGLHIVALRCASADAAHAALVEGGIPSPAPLALQRDAAFGPQGDQVRKAAFRNINLDGSTYPEARFIVIEHVTPDVLWQDHLLNHSNGAEALDFVLFRSADMDSTLHRFGPLLGPAAPVDGGARFDLRAGTCWVLPEEKIRKVVPVLADGPCHRVAAAGIKVASLDATRRLFDARGIAYTAGMSLDGDTPAIWVGPQEACHCALAFFEAEYREETK